jgi:hypothetical protein
MEKLNIIALKYTWRSPASDISIYHFIRILSVDLDIFESVWSSAGASLSPSPSSHLSPFLLSPSPLSILLILDECQIEYLQTGRKKIIIFHVFFLTGRWLSVHQSLTNISLLQDIKKMIINCTNISRNVIKNNYLYLHTSQQSTYWYVCWGAW